MLSAYCDFWARLWHDAAAMLDGRSEPVHWVVEFGSIRKPLNEIHADTGIPKLVEPVKARIESALIGNYAGLTIVFRIDPARGLMHALQGPESVVRRAQAALEAVRGTSQ